MIARTALLSGVVVVLAQLVHPPGAAARRDDETVRDAAKHFQRGVTLYGEADYRGALVEFNRAYEIAPNGAVLYNVGETQYQLRDYAGALTTFQRYLSESGPVDSHRAEVEANVRELRSRVGRLTIETVPRGAEVSVDDRVLGKTPFEEAVVVGVGHLKVTATMPGRAPVSRYVDVAAEDEVSVTLQLPVPAAGGSPARAAVLIPPAPGEAPPPEPAGTSLRPLGWVATGVLAAGAATFGILAKRASSDLQAARGVYMTSSATLNQKADRTKTYAIIADSLTAAAVIVGGITLFSSLGSHSEPGAAQVSIGPGSMRLEVMF